MQVLDNHEVEAVAGGDLEGFIWGLGEGVTTGLALGGSVTAYGGGWGFGLIAQLVGIIVGPIVGGAFGAVAGALTNKETVMGLAAHYRESIGLGNSSLGGSSGSTPLSFIGDMFGSNPFAGGGGAGPR